MYSNNTSNQNLDYLTNCIWVEKIEIITVSLDVRIANIFYCNLSVLVSVSKFIFRLVKVLEQVRGCTTKDIRDHIKPIIRKKPDQLIIHVGTNSVRDSESPTPCSEEIIHLISWTKSAAPGTEVVLSTLTAHSDDDKLATKVEEVNSNLKKFCRQNNWKMIVHSNITAEHHLNGSGLHLNKLGTFRLARNFLDFLKTKD